MKEKDLKKTAERIKLTEIQTTLCNSLFQIGAIRFGDFRLKLHDSYPEAPKSPIYIDLRMLRRFPETKRVAVQVYLELLGGLNFDLLADVPTAATPLVSAISDKLEIGMITPRTDKKKHGTGALIDGLLASDRGKQVVVIDDLVTRAYSKLEAIKILEAEGMRISDVVVLIDREQGANEQLEKQGYALHSALTLNQALNYYRQEGIIAEHTYADTLSKLDVLNSFLGAI